MTSAQWGTPASEVVAESRDPSANRFEELCSACGKVPFARLRKEVVRVI